jgi:hypothetical protein|tara:strand:- start:288 stop:413 length:126 start_codon:yes stop_codon:yes gene_type:complete
VISHDYLIEIEVAELAGVANFIILNFALIHDATKAHVPQRS